MLAHRGRGVAHMVNVISYIGCGFAICVHGLAEGSTSVNSHYFVLGRKIGFSLFAFFQNANQGLKPRVRERLYSLL